MGVALALLTAVLLAVSDVATRRLCALAGARGQKPPGPRELTALRLLLALPLLLLALPFVGPPPRSPGFAAIVLLGAPLEVAALLLYARALQRGPVSLSLPLLALTPVALLATGPLVAGSSSRPAAVPGVLLVAGGLWWLYAAAPEPGASAAGRTARLVAPLVAVARLPAARDMLAVAMIYSVTSALGKRAVVLAGPAATTCWYFLAVCALLVPLLAPRLRPALGWLRIEPRLTALLASSYAVHLFAHMAALSFLPPAEMIALKRSSVWLAVLGGGWVLGEGQRGVRLAASGLMVAGAAWISCTA